MLNIRKKSIIIFIIISLSILSLWFTRNSAYLSSVSGVDSYNLTFDEIKSLELQANRGNIVEIKRLRDYYAFVALDNKQTLYWAKKAADLGDNESKKMVEYIEKIIDPK